MSRSKTIVAIALLAYAGCSDRMPTEPTSSRLFSARAAMDDDALLVAPADASSICVASVAELIRLTAEAANSPSDEAAQAARVAQREITVDVCS
jgi:hypothetical protein